jgi:hypothetical protein
MQHETNIAASLPRERARIVWFVAVLGACGAAALLQRHDGAITSQHITPHHGRHEHCHAMITVTVTVTFNRLVLIPSKG